MSIISKLQKENFNIINISNPANEDIVKLYRVLYSAYNNELLSE